KGLYKKARAGEIRQFTGVSDAYEAPKNPDIELLTENLSPEEAAERVVEGLRERKVLL
ncbi:MAG: adenylyl-sulfate kinase, partial [Xanthomonadales bacterium]|nr:adenylyl-sulfate kinase [Xanthomonadales bacterium]